MKSRIPMFLMLFLPLLGACQGAGDSVMGLHQPRVDVDLVRLIAITDESATLEVIFTVRNPYSAPMTVAGYDYQVTSVGTPLVGGRYESYTVVPSKERTRFVTSFPIAFEQVMNAMPEVRPGHVIPYHAEFSLLITPPGESVMRIRAEHRGELPVPAPLKVSLLYVLWEDVTTDYISATMYLDTYNPNDFEFTLTGTNCSLSFGGEKISDIVVRRELAYPAGGARKFHVPFSFFPVKKGIATVRLIAEAGADYLLTGSLAGETKFGTVTLPIESSGRAAFRR